jgi:photosystem II stability/assembly factor-like uncharacterized protein
MINDGFMSADGSRLWTAEDGGRIRYRDPSGAWTYQTVSQFAKDTINRIHFLDDNLKGWAVGQGDIVKSCGWKSDPIKRRVP